MHWLIQKGFNDIGYHNLIGSLKNLNIKFDMVESLPFGGGVRLLPNEIDKDNVMFYGGMSLSNYALEHDWKACFLNDNFQVDKWIEHYGTELLNYDSVVTSINDAFPELEEFFARPMEDTKSFAGELMTKTDFLAWKHKVITIPEYCFRSITKDTMIAISPIKNILAEYRFFIVNDKIATQSEYKRNGQVGYYNDVGDYVISYVDRIIATWSPARAYCMDVAELENGELKIIELNNINSCGLYAVDTDKFVTALDTMFENQ